LPAVSYGHTGSLPPSCSGSHVETNSPSISVIRRLGLPSVRKSIPCSNLVEGQIITARVSALAQRTIRFQMCSLSLAGRRPT
jgi:hypothetical protein